MCFKKSTLDNYRVLLARKQVSCKIKSKQELSTQPLGQHNMRTVPRCIPVEDKVYRRGDDQAKLDLLPETPHADFLVASRRQSLQVPVQEL